MKPVVGHTIHYFVPHCGWRPLLITNVRLGNYPHDTAPKYEVCGWAKLCPSEVGHEVKMRALSLEVKGDIASKNEFPVVWASEGSSEWKWRWPPEGRR